MLEAVHAAPVEQSSKQLRVLVSVGIKTSVTSSCLVVAHVVHLHKVQPFLTFPLLCCWALFKTLYLSGWERAAVSASIYNEEQPFNVPVFEPVCVNGL